MEGMAVLKLTGTAGVVKDSVFTIPEGGEAVLGRSRDCGISLQALGAAPQAAAETPEAKAFLGISRCHARIRFKRIGEVEIVDQSRYGTFLDRERIDTVILTDLKSHPYTLRLGRLDSFLLEILDA